MSRCEKLLHPATFISLIALFVAMGGVGYAATQIGTKQIKNRAVTNAKLAPNSVSTSKIRRGAVRNGDLANNSVSSAKIQPGSIVSGDLGAGSILNGNLANGAVTGAKIANETIGTVKLQNGSVASDKIGTGAVTATKLGANSVTTAAIAPGAVGAAQIAPGQVVTGNGQLSSSAPTLGEGAAGVAVLTLPGLGVLQAGCDDGDATLEFVNTSGVSINVRYWGLVPAGFNAETVAAGGTSAPLPSLGVGGDLGATWTVSTVGGTPRVATINVSSEEVAVDDGCALAAQAIYSP